MNIQGWRLDVCLCNLVMLGEKVTVGAGQELVGLLKPQGLRTK